MADPETILTDDESERYGEEFRWRRMHPPYPLENERRTVYCTSLLYNPVEFIEILYRDFEHIIQQEKKIVVDEKFKKLKAWKKAMVKEAEDAIKDSKDHKPTIWQLEATTATKTIAPFQLPTLEDIFIATQSTPADYETDAFRLMDMQLKTLGSTTIDALRLNLINSLNHTNLEDIESGKIYTYFGMIQYNMDEELYVPYYYDKDGVTVKNAMFQEGINTHDDNFEHNHHRNLIQRLKTRRIFHCVSVPGIWNEHTKDYDVYLNKGTCHRPENQISNPKLRKEFEKFQNFPMTTGYEKACIVKVCQPSWDLPLNSIVQFTGIVYKDDLPTDAEAEDFNFENLDITETRHDPPSWAIPRMHALCYKVIPACLENPYFGVPFFWTRWGTLGQSYLHILDDMKEYNDTKFIIREDIIKCISKVCFGDTLVAKYIMLSLFSKVESWTEGGLALGKFSLNIFGTGAIFTLQRKHFVDQLNDLIKELVPRSLLLDLAERNINGVSWVPRKTSTDWHLKSALLQLPSQTYLIVDENDVSLKTKDMSVIGQHNKEALQSLASSATMKYDIPFFHTQFQHDLPMIIISKNISDIKADVAVPIETEVDMTLFDLEPEDIETIRKYLNVYKLSAFKVRPEVEKKMQEDFVESRYEEGGDNYTQEDFSLLLTMARLIMFSHGAYLLEVEHWTEARDMHRECRARLVNFATQQATNLIRQYSI